MGSSSAPSTGRPAHDLWALGLLYLAIALLFHDLPGGFWHGDDTAILIHALDAPGLSAFLEPEVWRKLSPSNLTPWLSFSFKVDLWLGGPDPRTFYLHQLVSLGLLVTGAYGLGRLWMPAAWSLFFTLLFLAGAPTDAVVGALMTRHYLEGLLFAVLSVITFVLAERRQLPGGLILSGLFYALATTAKEVYVPIPLILLLMPTARPVRQRLAALIPFGVIGGLYILWRRYMLGDLIGGYTPTESGTLLQPLLDALGVFSGFPALLLGPYWALPTGALAAVLAFVLVQRPRALPLALALLLGVLGPMLPLTRFPGISGPDRYLFLLWFCLCLCVALACMHAVRALPLGGPGKALTALVLALTALLPSAATGHALAESRKKGSASFDVQGRFINSASEAVAFIPSQEILGSYWFFTSLCELKQRTGSGCPHPVIRGVPVHKPVHQLFKLNPQRGVMEDVSARLEEEMRLNGETDLTRPLSARFTLEHGRIHWELGPYDTGTYYIASDALGRYALPPKGTLRSAISGQSFYVQYESPEGWLSTSPQLHLRAGQVLSWERPPGAQ